jgi:hypothetical protein
MTVPLLERALFEPRYGFACLVKLVISKCAEKPPHR